MMAKKNRTIKINKQKVAAGYCRVSTVEQVNKISLSDQVEQIKQYCEKHNFNLLNTYIEKGFSGSTEDRPEYRKMLIGAAQQEFSVLVVTDSDRFGRSVEDRHRIRKMFTRDFGIELHSIADGVFKDSATGKFQDTMKAGVSEYFRDLQVEKSASAISFKLEKGERNIARTFYGLMWAPDKKSAIHHPEEYPNVRKVVQLRIKKKWSYAAIAEHLNKKKIQYKKGKSWDGHKISYICSVNAKTYSQGRSFVSFQGQKYEYTFPPLISKLELSQLEGISPDFIIKGRPRIQYLLSGKLVCGICGTRIQHHKIFGRCNGKKKVYQYYTCRNKLEPANGERCKLPSIPQKWLEWWVWQHLTNAKSMDDKKRMTEIYERLESIKNLQTTMTEQINRMLDTIATGEIPEKYVRGKINSIHKNKNKAQREQNELEQELSLIEQRIDYLKKLPETRLWWLSYAEKLKDKDRRKLIDTFIERVEVHPRTYTKAQAKHDDKYGGVPEAGFGTKVSLNIIGHIQIIGP